jgi:hypothetical protein
MKKPKRSRLPSKKTLIIILFILVIGIAVFVGLKGVESTKRLYYNYRVRSTLARENKKLGEPLKALGFTDIKGGKPVCYSLEAYADQAARLSCSTELQSYAVFSDDASKSRAISAAEQLSAKLKQNGWEQGNYEIGTWFKDVLNGVDYNPDAYHSKYFGNTFCVLDFFVAYSNPNPTAVNVMFNCTIPGTPPLAQ